MVSHFAIIVQSIGSFTSAPFEKISQRVFNWLGLDALFLQCQFLCNFFSPSNISSKKGVLGGKMRLKLSFLVQVVLGKNYFLRLA